jgi:hypothetical protein
MMEAATFTLGERGNSAGVPGIEERGVFEVAVGTREKYELGSFGLIAGEDTAEPC